MGGVERIGGDEAFECFFLSLFGGFPESLTERTRPLGVVYTSMFELGNFDRLAVVGIGRDVYFLEA